MLKNIFPLIFIVATRFFGLFIILPVISLEVLKLNGGDTILAGVAIGIYALFQMIFSVPFGYFSDKFGRKKLIVLGLLIFIIGSVICANASEIYTLIFGRMLQGMGAVGGVAIALMSDFTKEEKRGKVMSIMGIMIGLSFAVAMVISPILNEKFGFASLFYLSAILTLLCIFLLYGVIDKEPQISSKKSNAKFIEIIKNKDIMIINFSNFLQKTLMTMAFFIIPIVLVNSLNFPQNRLFMIYSIAMIFGFLAMGLSGFLGEAKKLSKWILLAGIDCFFIAYFIFWQASSVSVFAFGVVVFFLGFCMHEPLLQSIASKFAKSSQKGLVLGIFNAFGYLGTFFGGIFAAIMFEKFGLQAIAVMVVGISSLWIFLVLLLSDPHIFKNIYLNFTPNLDKISQNLGIVDSYQMGDKFVIKYNSKLTNESEIYEILGIKNEQN